MIARVREITTAIVPGRSTAGLPLFIARTNCTCCSAESTFTTTPLMIRDVPTHNVNRADRSVRVRWLNSSSRRNRPNRAPTNPNPINDSPVRIHARNVRSAARYTRVSPTTGGLVATGSGTFQVYTTPTELDVYWLAFEK